jgi:hypothetical protein
LERSEEKIKKGSSVNFFEAFFSQVIFNLSPSVATFMSPLHVVYMTTSLDAHTNKIKRFLIIKNIKVSPTNHNEIVYLENENGNNHDVIFYYNVLHHQQNHLLRYDVDYPCYSHGQNNDDILYAYLHLGDHCYNHNVDANNYCYWIVVVVVDEFATVTKVLIMMITCIHKHIYTYSHLFNCFSNL